MQNTELEMVEANDGRIKGDLKDEEQSTTAESSASAQQRALGMVGGTVDPSSY